MVKTSVKNITQYSKPRYPEYEIEDDKSYTKFIKKVERYIRTSLEYKEYINFLKSEINMNQCSLFKNIDRTELSGMSIEIHHSPFTLYDLTSIVTSKHSETEGRLNPILIAQEVMDIHFRGMVGLIPLSVTVHQLVHSGDIFIPIDKVYGNVLEFINTYKQYFTQEQKELLEQIVITSENLNNYSPSVLERNYTYLNIDGMQLPKKLPEHNLSVG